MSVPSTYTSVNDTGCCAVPNVDDWDGRTIDLHQQFIRMHTRSLFHIPLTMGRVMKALDEAATRAGAQMPGEHAMVLSRDLSPWRAEQLFAVSAPVEGADNVVLDGTFASRAFEGPYSQAPTWRDGLVQYAASLGRDVAEVYFFYTTCPKCARHYGSNFVIVLGRLV
ncbi:hydrolase [Longivirga aurantiaca]|uniref:Hydrolase n=1 Tax=Longivirga aurantiaca TaxID=1837743 RepID=A0ABW1SWK6_9ACTN